MKLIKLLSVITCSLALIAGSAMAEKSDKKENKLKGKIVAGSCCDKKIKKGEECNHPCCVDAKKEGKVCDKCNKEEKKEEKK